MGKIRVRGLQQGLQSIRRTVRKQVEDSMNNAIDDLTRLSSEITPLDKGDLEQSWENDVNRKGNEYEGMVRFECWNKNPKRSYDFNYAIWIHENQSYSLGPLSKAKGGSTGLSGTFYPVDRGYLTRPLYGEAETYRTMIEQDIKRALK